MRDETAFSSTTNHDKSSILPFSNTEVVLFLFQLMFKQRIDMNDIIRKSDVESDTARQRVWEQEKLFPAL